MYLLYVIYVNEMAGVNGKVKKNKLILNLSEYKNFFLIHQLEYGGWGVTLYSNSK
jgi:hypothetical protein